MAVHMKRRRSVKKLIEKKRRSRVKRALKQLKAWNLRNPHLADIAPAPFVREVDVLNRAMRVTRKKKNPRQ